MSMATALYTRSGSCDTEGEVMSEIAQASSDLRRLFPNSSLVSITVIPQVGPQQQLMWTVICGQELDAPPKEHVETISTI